MPARGLWWLAVQLAAIAAGIALGARFFEAVTT
jgi:hypothetical protein